jgi:hypothetical protein
MSTGNWLKIQAILTSRVARVILIVGCLAGLFLEVYKQVSTPYTSDFTCYYNAAIAVRNGLNPLAPTAAWLHAAGGMPNVNTQGTACYAYAPIFALTMSPLSLLPIKTAFTVWVSLCLFFLLLSVYACLRIAGRRPSLLTVVLLAVVIASSNLIRGEYSLGQKDLFLLVLMGVAFWTRQVGYPVLASIPLGFACAIQPQLLVLLPFLLWKREFRFTAATLSSFLVLFFTPFIWLGGQALRDQVDIWRYYSSNTYLAWQYDLAPKGYLTRLFTPNIYAAPVMNAPELTTVLWLLVVVLVVASTAALVMPRRLAADGRTLFEIGLVLSALCLISPLTESTYLVVLVVPLVACYCLHAEPSAHPRAVQAFAILPLVVWVALGIPLRYYHLPTVSGTSLVANLYRMLGPGAVYLYLMIAIYLLQLRLLHEVTGRSTFASIERFVRKAPTLAQQWLLDARTALAGNPRTVAGRFKAAESPAGHQGR